MDRFIENVIQGNSGRFHSLTCDFARMEERNFPISKCTHIGLKHLKKLISFTAHKGGTAVINAHLRTIMSSQILYNGYGFNRFYHCNLSLGTAVLRTPCISQKYTSQEEGGA